MIGNTLLKLVVIMAGVGLAATVLGGGTVIQIQVALGTLIVLGIIYIFQDLL